MGQNRDPLWFVQQEKPDGTRPARSRTQSESGIRQLPRDNRKLREAGLRPRTAPGKIRTLRPLLEKP